MSAIEVRSATHDELPRAVDALLLAFGADPFTRWIFPDAHDYVVGFSAVLRESAARAAENGSAYVTSDFGGAALWLPPGVQPNEQALASVFLELVRGQHLSDFMAVYEKMNGFHPDEAHWYLPMIGVDPTRQGGGLGSALLHRALARIDDDGLLAYLESSNPANISLYERHGFEVIGEIRVSDLSLVTPMLRKPR
ncbi:MAG: GNAT family N-acetyltransferase [Myxococcota bacterium]